MTYKPFSHNLTTSETPTGRKLNDAVLYTKIVKVAGTIATGSSSAAHGITGLARLVTMRVSIERSNGQVLFIPLTHTGLSSTFHIGAFVDGTNINFQVGTGWTGAGNVLSDAWVVLEYTKT